MEIPLSQNKVTIVDPEDYELTSQFKWSAHQRSPGYFYAARTDWKTGKTISLHRLLLGLSDPKVIVDHINGDTLDNRRSNLRRCTTAENLRNRKLSTRSTSGYKGVYWAKHVGRWRALIGFNGKLVYLGYFDDPEEAAAAYNEAALRLYGDFARLNTLKLGKK